MSMEEIWKDIVGYEGLYQVSNLGRVKRLVSVKCKTERFIAITKDKKFGYCRVMLCKNNKTKRFLIHRLLAEHFIPNPENKPCIDHINGDRSDNRIENLRWCTYKENNNFPIARKNYLKAQIEGRLTTDWNKNSKESIQKVMKRPEVRKKISEARKRFFEKNKNKDMSNVHILQYDYKHNFIKEYNSIKEASINTGIQVYSINRCCNGIRKTCGGYMWEYKEVEK